MQLIIINYYFNNFDELITKKKRKRYNETKNAF